MPHTDDYAPRIYYEVHGEPEAPALVLIEGLGTQLVGWRKGFLDRLRKRGLRLVLLDNRDVGLSAMCGEPGEEAQAYTIADMAHDVTRVLDAAGVGSAHVVGQSMGGAIAQSFAIHHPARVRSMTLFYTAPCFDGEFVGEGATTRPPPPPRASRSEAIEARVASERFCASPLYGFDEDWAREAAALAYDRSPRTDGAHRQRAALVASADHRDLLGGISAPTAIIHGRGDRIVRWQGGDALARLIPGADLHLYTGLGHVVAQPLWPEFVAIIDGVVRRADGQA